MMFKRIRGKLCWLLGHSWYVPYRGVSRAFEGEPRRCRYNFSHVEEQEREPESLQQEAR
jgi:hypothetical protein